MHLRKYASIAGLAMLAVACGSSPESTDRAAPSSAAPTTTTLAQFSDAPETAPPTVDDAPTDWGLPSVAPDTPTGALGFTRYVWTEADDNSVVPVLVEGPRANAVRCQDPIQPCSYSDLKELNESGAEIPAHLNLSADELSALVGQLDQTAAAVASFADINDACAAGYVPVSAFNPNMGVHLTNTALLADGFDPAAPEMLLYGSEQALGLTRDELGGCDGDVWTGVNGLVPVGAAFFIDISDDHPDGFVGPIDNWHVHYNSCAGGQLDSLGSRSLCEQRGGRFFDLQPNWMMHAYVAPGFDSQTGVFGMWNDSVWPIGDNPKTTTGVTADVTSTIVNFAYQPVVVAAGDTVLFDNLDQVPHTVTAGSPAQPDDLFDSGLLATDDTFALVLDTPGRYSFYCELHPMMQATVTVE